MADFEVLVEKVLNVEDHPNADRLSIVTVRGFRCISAKVGEDNHPRYKTGDLVIYVPEGAIVPEWLLKKGFWNDKDDKGMLAGPKGDRVKAIKLRGEVSQGILFSVDTYPEYDSETDFVLKEWLKSKFAYDQSWSIKNLDEAVEEGTDVTELLGITKWEPVVPDSFAGEAGYVGRENFPHFDIENVRKFPNLFSELTEVIVDEKLHGTCFISGYIPGLDSDNAIDRDFVVTSKGFAGKGISLVDSPSNQESNLYIKAFHNFKIKEALQTLSAKYDNKPVYILGEVYGEGVQDLGYSQPKGSFKAFGIFVGRPIDGDWLDPRDKYADLMEVRLSYPTILYSGTFNMEKILAVTSGLSSEDDKTIREGVVITPVHGFKDRQGRRAILKSVSPEYLLRKGNTTEFQ